jgi:hypothetical protein
VKLSKNAHAAYTLEDYYLSYKEHIGNNRIYHISKRKFYDIVKDYNQYISEQVILKSRDMKLPARLGSISVIKHKPKKFDSESLRVDFKSTKELGKLVLHLNEHSDGYNYRFRWNKSDIVVPNRSFYEFITTRANKRLLAKVIKEKTHDYTEI